MGKKKETFFRTIKDSFYRRLCNFSFRPTTLTLSWNYKAMWSLRSRCFHEQLKKNPLNFNGSGKTLVQPHFSRTTPPNAVQTEWERKAEIKVKEGKRIKSMLLRGGCNTVRLQRQRCQTATVNEISGANALFSGIVVRRLLCFHFPPF